MNGDVRKETMCRHPYGFGAEANVLEAMEKREDTRRELGTNGVVCPNVANDELCIDMAILEKVPTLVRW